MWQFVFWCVLVQLTPLRNALASLEAGLEVVGDANRFDRQPEKVRNTLVAGVIQYFEFVYEIGFKMTRRQIESEAPSPDEVDESSFRDIARIAAEKGLISGVIEALSESDLPYRVDGVEWDTTDESFRNILERDKVVVKEAR